VLGIELHQTPDYEAGADFFTCYEGDVVFWLQVDKPVEGGIFVGYRGAQPAHVGLVLNRQALHSRGENGSVRMDSLLVIQRAFTKVEFFEYGAG
ncbi:peptidoglycan endopeptidase, partial [Enterobacter cloacae complex sp. SHL021]